MSDPIARAVLEAEVEIEREACARICDREYEIATLNGWTESARTANNIAVQIRARRES